MSLNIDLQGIKTGFTTAYQTTSVRLGAWKGRVLAWLQAGTQTAMPYLQDKKIAVISLIGVTLLLTHIADLFAHLCNKCLPNNNLTDFIITPLAVSIIAGGVVGFVTYTQLPLAPLAVLGISVGTIFLRIKLPELLRS